MKSPVAKFCLQPTRSFPDGAPQREEYLTDNDYLTSVRLYRAEWKVRYVCQNKCNDSNCPQCGRSIV